MTVKLVLTMTALALLLAGCAYVPPVQAPSLPGFFLGLLHGFISPFTVFLAIFTDVQMYATPNSGNWYDFGFLLGASCILGGGGAGAKRRRR